MKKIKKEPCPFCGKKTYYHQIKPLTLEYKGQRITVKQPANWCDSCKEGVISSLDSKATQKQLQEFRANVDDLLTPDDIKNI